MARTCGLSVTETLDVAAEEKTGRRRSIGSPPTWVLLDPGSALEEVPSEVSGSVESAEDESSAESFTPIAGGWGTSF